MHTEFPIIIRSHFGNYLTHWGWVTHICVGNLNIIGSDNGLSPGLLGRPGAIIWTSAGILLIGPLGTNFSEILIGIQTFSFKKMHLKMSPAKWRPFCPGLNVLKMNQNCFIQAIHTKDSLTLWSKAISWPHDEISQSLIFYMLYMLYATFWFMN